MFNAGWHDLRAVLLVKFMTLCFRIGVFVVSYPCSMKGVKDISVVNVLTIAFRAANTERMGRFYTIVQGKVTVVEIQPPTRPSSTECV